VADAQTSHKQARFAGFAGLLFGRPKGCRPDIFLRDRGSSVYNRRLIVTLTLNPAIDRTISVDRLAFEDRAYIESTGESPGGRGINAACVIHSFGGKALAIITSGGQAGARLEDLLKCCGYNIVVVPIRNPCRTNLTITDRHGLTVNLNEAGPQVEKAEVTRVEKVIREKTPGAAWLMLSGSLPPGVPSSFYAKMIAQAKERKVKTLLDADGEALRQGIEAGPTVASPNQQEAERLLNRALLTTRNFLDAVSRIRQMGAESVVLSLGSRGAVGTFGNRVIEAVPPRIDAVSPIGSGDALAAAFVWAMERNSDFADALRWGVATGTASALLPGLKFASREQSEKIYQQVEVRKVERV
jgi:6-phosphofructokinase 2